jgi:hypothetical protein
MLGRGISWQKWHPAIQGFCFAACGKVCKYLWHPFHSFLTIAVAIFTIIFCDLLAESCLLLKHGLFWLMAL